MEVAVLGIDVGKNVCSLAGFDGLRKVIFRRRMTRDRRSALAERLPPVWWRWKHAAERIIPGGYLLPGATRFA